MTMHEDPGSGVQGEEEFLHIVCHGSPREIGQHHGRSAAAQIRSTMAFYAKVFEGSLNMPWERAITVAERFLPRLEREMPELVEEMVGIAEGASLSLGDVLALNARSEIMFGNAGDGCTAFSWKPPSTSSSWLAQNWDFHLGARPNLIAQTIVRGGDGPVISQIIEAGMLGKIGLNSAGVGVCFNAIVAPGTDFQRLPVHVALRAVLEQPSRHEAVALLDRVGLASACHILVADAATGGVGLEFSAADCVALPMDARGVVTHTNHFLRPHGHGVVSQVSFATQIRQSRVDELLREAHGRAASRAAVEAVLADELYWPYSINRAAGKETPAVTLFSIAMDLEAREAAVKIGRPTEPIATLVLMPGSHAYKPTTS